MGGQSGALLVCLTGLLGTSSQDIGVSPGLGLLVSDSSCWCGESTMTSAGLSDASVLDIFNSSLLDSRRSIDTKFSVLTWGLPLRHLRAALL